MKNFELVQTERRSVMEIIARGLKQVNKGLAKSIEESDGYREPFIGAIPTLVVNIPVEYKSDEERAGFAVTISQKTFKPIAASWYRANGVSTYRESKLTEEELEDLKKYYAKYLRGLWSQFSKCIID